MVRRVKGIGSLGGEASQSRVGSLDGEEPRVGTLYG
jgi:hypothetical protein